MQELIALFPKFTRLGEYMDNVRPFLWDSLPKSLSFEPKGIINTMN